MDLVSSVLMEAGDTGYYRHQLASAIPGVSCHVVVWCGVVWRGVVGCGVVCPMSDERVTGAWEHRMFT